MVLYILLWGLLTRTSFVSPTQVRAYESPQAVYCSIVQNFDERQPDGTSKISSWRPCVAGENTPLGAGEEAIKLCSRMGFGHDQVWEVCARLLWQNHLNLYYGAIERMEPLLKCPNYFPQSLSRAVGPTKHEYLFMEPGRLRVLEVVPEDGDRNGCFIADWSVNAFDMTT